MVQHSAGHDIDNRGLFVRRRRAAEHRLDGFAHAGGNQADQIDTWQIDGQMLGHPVLELQHKALAEKRRPFMGHAQAAHFASVDHNVGQTEIVPNVICLQAYIPIAPG
ncbi:hypothetical protein WT56_29690 [Burkholderia pseudomultivorans]|uniref:Uncharacterized protein n=1 Tax=Burkholderia pseudomultivorans TaxID=1207504 RepID=A0A132E899_9BURK|nr:hypothetical protein WT56_29690 [Burkholderia pseudomultivorans]